jgi:hypothetical protein
MEIMTYLTQLSTVKGASDPCTGHRNGGMGVGTSNKFLGGEKKRVKHSRLDFSELSWKLKAKWALMW